MSASNSNCSTLDTITEGAGRVVRGTVAGFFGGLIASWVMNQYQTIESRPVNVRRTEAALSEIGVSEPQSAQHMKKQKQENSQATVKAAEMVSRKLFEHSLTHQQKQVAGPAVHFGFGATVGALYGGLAEVIPLVSIGMGIPYATMVWLGADEIAVPALGLSKSPTEVPPEAHASQLAMHFVYGITLDITRRILRRVI